MSRRQTRIDAVERTVMMVDLLRQSYPAERNGILSHVVIEEVAPGTGWAATQRWADMLALSVWPSKGLTLDGYELKASRSDLRRELADPTKHEAVAQYCDTWSLVAWDEGVLVDGIPNWWGITDVGEDLFTWPAATDKTGRTWQQPIRAETAHVLTVARSWRERNGYAGPWVFYSSHQDGLEPYKVQAFWRMLREAEKRAGVEHHAYRAAHGFRRMVVTEIVARTGNLVHALQFVGDRDLKQAKVYVKERPDVLVAVAAALDAPPNHPAEPPVSPKSLSRKSHRSESNRRPLDYESRALPLSYGGRMPWPGFEPGRLAALPPQDSVSTRFHHQGDGFPSTED